MLIYYQNRKNMNNEKHRKKRKEKLESTKLDTPED